MFTNYEDGGKYRRREKVEKRRLWASPGDPQHVRVRQEKEPAKKLRRQEEANQESILFLKAQWRLSWD